MKLNFGSDTADDLRGLGWMTAVHNDYRHNGEKFTFWLLTYPLEGGGFLALQGEAKTDVEALDNIRYQVNNRDFKTDYLDYEPQISFLQRDLAIAKEKINELEAAKEKIKMLTDELKRLIG
jgi:hypothetical protein